MSLLQRLAARRGDSYGHLSDLQSWYEGKVMSLS